MNEWRNSNARPKAPRHLRRAGELQRERARLRGEIEVVASLEAGARRFAALKEFLVAYEAQLLAPATDSN